MTEVERISNIVSFGYTERQANFLCRAALHGGYFVRRQYLAFADCERGRTDTALMDKAVTAGHVKQLRFRYNRTVYSFCSKPFFRALGNTDNRNRRTHEVPTIKSRLIGFDFVLSHQELNYLATEAEKVSFFRERFGIALKDLPTKRYRAKASAGLTERYFVDKFPIGVEYVGQSEDRVVFTYVDDGNHSTSGFEAYLEDYRPLFAILSRFRIVYVSVNSQHLDAAKRLVDSRLVVRSGRLPSDPDVDRLLRHFQDRDAYSRKDLSRFDQNKLIRFREDRHAFSGPKNDELFEAWRLGGESEVLRHICPDRDQNASAGCDFSTWVSGFPYELFGTITSGK